MKSVVIIFLSMFMTLSLAGQDKIGLEISMTYAKMADGTVRLRAEVYDEEEYEPVMDLEFEFYSVFGDQEVLLGTAFSNDEALVQLSGVSFEEILRDEGDWMNFRLDGINETYEGSAELTIRHVDLVINFDVVDSVNILSVSLTGKDEEGNPTGIEDGEVYFFVPRLYGNLAIGDVWTDGDGYDEMKFPTDIPGDAEGNLHVIARITESDDFGSIEVMGMTNWGLPNAGQTLEDRVLWSPNAPLWMVITFAILITGVFFHYGWVIFNLIRIKRLAE